MPQMIPCLHYRDGHAAIDWLGRAFGFEKHAAYDGEDGTLVHAELKLGEAFVMLGSNADPVFNWKSPDDAGCVTQSTYVVVDDPDALHDRARTAGAEIVRNLTDTDYGSREFSARDPEGHLWHFGTYAPG
jgi:uncharacterized glyoxalase superfamily protein PhnB